MEAIFGKGTKSAYLTGKVNFPYSHFLGSCSRRSYGKRFNQRFLKDITTVRHIDQGAKFHHERYDGSGYPLGLKGLEIPEVARIIAIADAYDAMTSDRCYRPNLGPDEAAVRLSQGAGDQFDPELVEIFVQLLREGLSQTVQEAIRRGAASNQQFA